MKYIEVLSNRLPTRVPLPSVLWLNTEQNAILLHTDGGVIKTYMTFSRMKALLDGMEDCFLMCYKGCLVNMDRVLRIAGPDFLMENGELVQVRKKGGNQIRQSYILYRCERAAARQIAL